MKPPISFIVVAFAGILAMIAMSGFTVQAVFFWAVLAPIMIGALVWLFSHILGVRK